MGERHVGGLISRSFGEPKREDIGYREHVLHDAHVRNMSFD